MKKLITIIAVLLSFNSIAETDSTVTTYNIGLEGGSEVTDMLKNMASELNTTTEYLWEVTVKQGKVAAIKGLILCIIMSIFWILGSLILIRFMKKQRKNKLDDWEPFVAIFLISSIIIFAFGIIPGFNHFIDGTYNPEYWALETILDKLNPE